MVLALLFTAARAGAQVLPAEGTPTWPSESTAVAHDWVQLTSGEWLKGEFLGMYDDELEFDSAEMDMQVIEWEDVYQLRTAQDVRIGLLNGAVAIGKLMMKGTAVRVTGDGSLELQRSQVLTIAPWAGRKRLRSWSGKISLGLTVRQGNTDQIDSNLDGEIKRRSVRDRIVLDYLANLSRTDDADIADNQLLQANWDHFITDKFFVKPLETEWYRDPFQNVDSRTTAGVGAGYQLLDTKRTEWEVSAGLGYRTTRFANVAEGEDGEESTPAISGNTKFEQEWTKAVDFTCDYTFYFTNDNSGRYNHHMVVSFETEWTKALDFDVSFVWDRTQLPRPDAAGVVPDQDDFRMVVALGLEF